MLTPLGPKVGPRLSITLVGRNSSSCGLQPAKAMMKKEYQLCRCDGLFLAAESTMIDDQEGTISSKRSTQREP